MWQYLSATQLSSFHKNSKFITFAQVFVFALIFPNAVYI